MKKGEIEKFLTLSEREKWEHLMGMSDELKPLLSPECLKTLEARSLWLKFLITDTGMEYELGIAKEYAKSCSWDAGSGKLSFDLATSWETAWMVSSRTPEEFLFHLLSAECWKQLQKEKPDV